MVDNDAQMLNEESKIVGVEQYNNNSGIEEMIDGLACLDLIYA